MPNRFVRYIVIIAAAACSLSSNISFDHGGEIVDMGTVAQLYVYPGATVYDKTTPRGPSIYVNKLVTKDEFKKVDKWYREKFYGPSTDKLLENARYVGGDVDLYISQSQTQDGLSRNLLLRFYHHRNDGAGHEVSVVISRGEKDEASYVLVSVVELVHQK